MYRTAQSQRAIARRLQKYGNVPAESFHYHGPALDIAADVERARKTLATLARGLRVLNEAAAPASESLRRLTARVRAHENTARFGPEIEWSVGRER